MKTLVDVQERIGRIQDRLLGHTQSDTARPRKRHRCGFCSRSGHNIQTCLFRGLSLWMNSSDIYIARSAEDAARIERDFVNTFADPGDRDRPEMYTAAGEWSPVNEEPLTLRRDGAAFCFSQRAWIFANGRCLLAYDADQLEACREVPSP